jgi:glycosyltransferase involved in cell wall biosynthesis
MKILHLFPYVPVPPTFGGALRVYHILNHLYKNYDDLYVAGFNRKGELTLLKDEFPIAEDRLMFEEKEKSRFSRLIQMTSFFSSHSYWYNFISSSSFQTKLDQLLEREDFDIILTEFASMGVFDLKTDAVTILDAHNVEYDNFRRMSKLKWSFLRKKFYESEFKKVRSEEIEIFNRYDAVFATSERDKNIIEGHAKETKHFVIPNGVDTKFFKKNEQVKPAPFDIVFTGAMSYLPNQDGIMYFLDEIFPLIKNEVPEAKIYVVGSRPPEMLQKYASDDVIITGFVDDVRPYIDRSSVYVVPLNMGSGTRLKVLEAMSMKIPIVSTSIGCEGIEIEDGKNILVRNEPKEFANAVIELMKNKKLAKRLINEGYELVVKKYDWSVICKGLDEAFIELLSKKANSKKSEKTTQPV